MQRRTDLVDQYLDLTKNYDRGFHHFLKVGEVVHFRNDIPNDQFDGGPLGKANASGLLVDPNSDYELSTNIFARGAYRAEQLCDEWAIRCEWQVMHRCPLRKKIETYNRAILARRCVDGKPEVIGHVPTTTEVFLPCLGLPCAYWNFWNGSKGPCLLVPEPD